LTAKSRNPFRYFGSSPEVIRLVVMMYVKYPLSPRNVEDLLHERGIDICHETVRFTPSNRRQVRVGLTAPRSPLPMQRAG
jgi:transposase-like protein